MSRFRVRYAVVIIGLAWRGTAVGSAWGEDRAEVAPAEVAERGAIERSDRFDLEEQEARSGDPGGEWDKAVVRGRVLDPTGKPVAGAMVQTVHRFDDPYPPMTAATDGEGKFALANSGRFETTTNNTGNPLMIASALGFGCGWADHQWRRAEATITLVAPGPPIEGRLVDPAGQPVAGVTVEVSKLWVPIRYNALTETGTLAPYFAPRDPRTPLDANLQEFRWTGPSATTDAAGRFVIPGLGPERLVVLVARSPTIATTRFTATTSTTMTEPVDHRDGVDLIRWYPARCEVVVAPGRSVAGVVTDAATVQPLADWRVTGARSPGRDPRYDEVTTATDAAGRYTLTGLRPGGDDWVLFNPPAGQPYLAAGFRIPSPAPDAENATPSRLDLAARRGVVVRGRVADKLTQAPLVGHVVAGAIRAPQVLHGGVEGIKSNPHLKDYPGYADSRSTPHFTDADGRYEVVLPPGPGVVAFQIKERGDHYIGGQGYEAISGLVRPWATGAPTYFSTVPEPIYLQYQIFASIDPPAGNPGLTLDLKVDSWRTVTLNVLGPDGQPFTDRLTDVDPNSMFRSEFIVGRTPKIRYLVPGSSRQVSVIQEDRKLAGTVAVEADGPPMQTLRLGRWGEVQGRIINADKTPRADVAIRDDQVQQPYPPTGKPVGHLSGRNRPWNNLPPPPGEFHLIALVPGLHYRLFVRSTRADQNPMGVIGDLGDDVTVQPGEIKDLGNLQVRPLSPPPIQPKAKP